MEKPRTPWPHAPLHQLSQRGTYFLTVGTYLKAHHFHRRERLRVLHRGLLTVARDFGWRLEAWAVFSDLGHLLPDRWHLSQSAPFPPSRTPARSASWPSNCSARLRLAARSLGRVFQPLPFRGPFSRTSPRRRQSLRHAQTFSHQNRNVDQSARPNTESESLA